MLKTDLGKLNLQTCIYNASGPLCTDLVELKDLNSNSYTGAILSKSCTLESRIGNELPRYYETDSLSINSTGLANLGYREYLNFADQLTDKPYIISVSGLSLEDNVKIISEIGKNNSVKGIELNLSCPNVIGKPQIGYDFEAIDNILRAVFESYDNTEQIFGIKLPPYFDRIHFQQVADILKNYPRLNFLTCVNSLGNGLVINDETTAIKPNEGFGGIGGSCIKPIALSNVRHFYQLFGNNIDIIGCGGITNGRDAFEHILCGASAVQIGTQYMKEGVKCFERVSNELIEIMNNKGYHTINEFKGRINFL